MILQLFFVLASSLQAQAVPVTISTQDLSGLPKSILNSVHIKLTSPLTAELNLTEEQIGALAIHMHQQRGRCGGFVVGNTDKILNDKSFKNVSIPLELKRQPEVLALLPLVEEGRMRETIQWFSSYKTRYYLTPEGIQAMEDLADKWRDLVKDLPYAEVELFRHADWQQPSVILKIKGSQEDEIIMGGHGDSINTDSSDIHAHAPGADDNASGISVLTEIIRVLAAQKHQPKSTLTFIAYAAEEVGLRGSMDISADYASKRTPVKSVLQFDGTNFKGSQEFGMVLIDDLVDPKLNVLLEKLINNYLKLPWTYDRCGYACSDHYSWTYRGFSAAFPFESKIAQENPTIHTARDLLSVSGENAYHAVPFARLGLAYLLEMDQ